MGLEITFLEKCILGVKKCVFEGCLYAHYQNGPGPRKYDRARQILAIALKESFVAHLAAHFLGGAAETGCFPNNVDGT